MTKNGEGHLSEPWISDADALSFEKWVEFLGRWISPEWIEQKLQEVRLQSDIQVVKQEVIPLTTQLKSTPSKLELVREAV